MFYEMVSNTSAVSSRYTEGYVYHGYIMSCYIMTHITYMVPGTCIQYYIPYHTSRYHLYDIISYTYHIMTVHIIQYSYHTANTATYSVYDMH